MGSGWDPEALKDPWLNAEIAAAKLAQEYQRQGDWWAAAWPWSVRPTAFDWWAAYGDPTDGDTDPAPAPSPQPQPEPAPGPSPGGTAPSWWPRLQEQLRSPLALASLAALGIVLLGIGGSREEH